MSIRNKYDIDFSDENISRLSTSIDLMCEFLEKNGVWSYVNFFKDLKVSAENYNFSKFRELSKDPFLVGGMNSVNDYIFNDSKIESEFKTRFKELLELIIKMGHNHPKIIRTYKSL